MKKLLFLFIVILCLGYSSMAQKKDSVITLPEIRVTAVSKVNEQVKTSFQQAFSDAVWVRWHKMNKDYLVKFIKADMGHSAFFLKNGYLKYDISYGFESNLPIQVREDVKSGYRDFMITHVAHVQEAQRDIWVINLESLTYYVIVRSENGELEEVERFGRSE
jgi:hypothetical protein